MSKKTLQEKVVAALKKAGKWHDPETVIDEPIYANRKERRAAESAQRAASLAASVKNQVDKTTSAATKVVPCSSCRRVGAWIYLGLCPTCERKLSLRAASPKLSIPATPTPKRVNEKKAKSPPPAPRKFIRLRDHTSPPMPKHLQAMKVSYERPATSRIDPVHPIVRDPDLVAKQFALEKALAQVHLDTAPGTLLYDDGKHMYVAAECSCRGTREDCARCDGRGVYPRHELVDGTATVHPNRKRPGREATRPSGFSNDSRGGVFGIREDGRFLSVPHYEGDSEIS